MDHPQDPEPDVARAPETNREAQPADGGEVDDAAEQAERIERHRRPSSDDLGIADGESRGGSPGRSPAW
jgi:hypothetical protein